MSVAGDIADAVAAAVASANDGVQVVRRKLPSLPPGKNPPQDVVSVMEEGEIEPLTAATDLVRYPVAVAMFRAGGDVQGDDDDARDWREGVRVAVNTPDAFSGVPGFNRVDAAGRSPFDRPAMEKGVTLGWLVFTVEAIEARN